MLPEFLNEAARQCSQEATRGRGLALYPRLEHLLAESRAEEWMWVPTLELGSAIYLWHGRFGEGERLARRAIARSLRLAPEGLMYRRALLALVRSLLVQGRRDEAEPIWQEADQGASDDWTCLHRQLWSHPPQEGWTSLGWDERWRRLSQPDPFPLWQEVRWVEGSLAEVPLWTPLEYPVSLDTIASWTRHHPEHRTEQLAKVKAWRAGQLSLRWLGQLGSARYSYSLEFQLLHSPDPSWISLELPGCGYEVLQWGERNPNLLLVPVPGQAQCWRVLFRGVSEVVSRGTRALLRVGFEDGRPPLQARLD